MGLILTRGYRFPEVVPAPGTGDVTAALLAQVRIQVGLAAVSGVTDQEVYDHLQRAQLDLMWRLHDGWLDTQLRLATGTVSSSAISIPTDFFRERKVTVGGVAATRWDVRRLGALPTASASNPFYWFWQGAFGVSVGDIAATPAYGVYYLGLPDAVGVTTDPELSPALYELLVDFACIRVLEGRQQWARAQTLYARYLAQVGALNGRFGGGIPFDGEPGVM
jgi:hypothetical protein